MVKTDAELLLEAEQIQNETNKNANSQVRVGAHLINLAESKVNNDKIETSPAFNTPGKTIAGRDQTKAYIDERLANLQNNSNHKFAGYFEDEADILARAPKADVGTEDGTSLINLDTDTYWLFDLASNTWSDSGKSRTPEEMDQYPTPGNFDRTASSGGIDERFGEKSNWNHGHSETEQWLIDILAFYIKSSSFDQLFWDRLKVSVDNGDNITIDFYEETRIAKINGVPGPGGSITIDSSVIEGSGNAVAGGGVFNHTKQFLKKYIWKTTALVGIVRTFDFDNVQNPVFRIEPTENEVWEFINVPTELSEFVSPLIRVKYSGIGNFTAILPDGTHWEDGTDNEISQIQFPTGKLSGFITAAWGYRSPEDEWTWSFGEGGSGGSGTTDYEDLDNKPLINGVELTGDKSLEELGIQDAIDLAEDSAKAYAESLVVGLWDDRGNFSAGGGAYPTTGGSGPGGAILKGDVWTISVAGTIGDKVLAIGDTLRALVDTPGSTNSNWSSLNNNVDFVPVEDSNIEALAVDGSNNIAWDQKSRGNRKGKVTLTGNATLVPTNVKTDGGESLLTVNISTGTPVILTFGGGYTYKSQNSTFPAYTFPTGTGLYYDITFLSKGTYIEVGVAFNAFATAAEIIAATVANKPIAPDQIPLSDLLTKKLTKIFAVTTGSSNAYVWASTPASSVYPKLLLMQASFTNTGASTIAPDGLAAVAITKNGTTPVASGDIVTNTIYILGFDGTQYQILGGIGTGGGGSGTVTSVAMTVPTGFSVSGSPITNSGTLAVSENNQNANLVKAGPSSGFAAAPAYRALVTDDLPSMGSYSWLGNNTPSSAKPTATPGVSRQQLMSEYQYAKEFTATSTLDKTAVVWIFRGTSNVDLNLQLLSNSAYSNMHWIIYNASPNSSTVTLQRAGSDQFYDGVAGLVNSKAISVGQSFDVNHGISNWMIR